MCMFPAWGSLALAPGQPRTQGGPRHLKRAPSPWHHTVQQSLVAHCPLFGQAWVSPRAFTYSSDFRVHKICPLTPSNLSPPFALRSLPRNLALFTLHKGGSWPGGCSPVMKWHNPGGEVGPFSLSPSLLCNFGTTAHHWPLANVALTHPVLTAMLTVRVQSLSPALVTAALLHLTDPRDKPSLPCPLCFPNSAETE